MRKLVAVAIMSIVPFMAKAQVNLTIEGTTVTNSQTGEWIGVNIPRNVPTTFSYLNNSVTSVNTVGYLLLAGEESSSSPNHNNLQGMLIAGNRFTWNGTDLSSITHGVFTGYNINALIRHNYLYKVPMSIIRKSNGMTNTSGGVAYNIIVSPNVGIVVKGMNSVNIFNNTFYSDRTVQTSRPFVDIYENSDISPKGSSKNNKVFNNIFYSKYQIPNISIESACFEGFECDYNLYYCEGGNPVFKVDGASRTFAQWQALGYDLHSVVIDPGFKDFVDFVPANRLDYGKDLGSTWQSGLATNAVWGTVSPATQDQNGTWQVGARILAASNGIGDNETGNGSAEKIKIYPNPAREYFIVLLQDTSTMPRRVNVFDDKGRIVTTFVMESEIKKIMIHNVLGPGVYYVSTHPAEYKDNAGKLVVIR